MSNSTKPGTSYRFVPIVRQGFRPQGTEFALDRPKKSSKITGPLKFPVELTVEATRKDGSGTKKAKLSKDVRLYGPGDVQGIDHDQVVRVEPEPNTADFPPSYFPLIEFNNPSLPWLFSPEYTKDDTKQWARNRPWIALVVVDKSEVSVTAEGPGNLPVLEAPTSELPPPSETWAWAHAQVVGEDGSLANVIGKKSSRTVSRLLCPRNLYRKGGKKGGTRYVAAVVPTFEPGRRVGLGRDPYEQSGNKGGNQSIGFAWSKSGSESVKLPMYYMWEFQVGSRGFESLVTELEPRQLSTSNVGVRRIDVSHPGPEQLIPTKPSDQTIDQVGALKSPSISPKSYQKSQTLVEKCLNKPHKLTTSGGSGSKTDKPVVGAPLYGQWYVNADQVTGLSKWFSSLNRDPAFRIAAGFGAEVIREHQEEFMEKAWDQAGEIDEMNRVLRSGQLSRATSNRIHLALGQDIGTENNRDLGRLLQFTQPLQGRLPDQQVGTEDISRTLKWKLKKEVTFPEPVLSPAYRRLTSPRGALVRNANLTLQQPNVSATGLIPPTAFANEFVTGRITPADLEEQLDPRVVTLDDMAPTGSRATKAMVAISGKLDETEPPTMVTTRVGSKYDLTSIDPKTDPSNFVSAGTGAGGMPSSAGSGQAPDADAGGQITDPVTGVDSGIPSREVPPPGTDGVEALPDDLLRIHRFGNWARSLPTKDLTPAEIRTAMPSDEEAFVIRKLDAQLQSAIEHTIRAIQELQRLSAEGSRTVTAPATDEDPGSRGGRSETGGLDRETVAAVDERVKAVGTNTFEPLDRTLDNLLSTRPDAIPAAIENDKGQFVQGLLDHHEAAKASLASLRTALGGQAPIDVGGQGPIDPGGVDPGGGAPGGVDPSGGEPGVDPNTGPPDRAPEQGFINKAMAHMLELLERMERLRAAISFGNEVLQPTAEVGDGVGDGLEMVQMDSQSILDLLDPDVTIPEKVLARTEGSGTDLRSRSDPLAEVLWAPSFDRPMFDPLRKLSEEYLMPGADDIPRKTIGAVATNPKFIESYLVGANHEFARELLWRRFPTDRNGTYFQKFWNDIQNPTSDLSPDITKIHNWNDTTKLGGTIGNPNVVLMLRGELLRQFPNTTIYMAKAKWTDKGMRKADVSAANHITEERIEKAKKKESDTLEKRIKFPIFRGTLDPDISFLGFKIAPKDAVGGELPSGDTRKKLKTMDPVDRPDPGWFFVFEEPMGETRFGLDAGDKSDKSAPMGIHQPKKGKNGKTVPIKKKKVREGNEVAWNGLSWHHVAKKDPAKLKYVKVWESSPGGEQNPNKSGVDEDKTWRVTDKQLQSEFGLEKIDDLKPDVKSSKAVWGRNSAHMARITFQRPVRMTVHADDILQPEANSKAWKNSAATNGGGG